MVDTLSELSRLLLALEEQLLTADIRCNANALAALLADEFMEFGSSGRTHTKQQITEELAVEVFRQISLHDFTCQALSPEAALVTYRSHSEAGEVLRSSVWVYRDHRWQMLFHQGTKRSPLSGLEAVS